MDSAVPAITPVTFEALVSPWLKSLAKPQDLPVVVSYPNSDRRRRLINLMDNSSLQAKYLGDSPYHWIVIDLFEQSFPDVFSLEQYLATRCQTDKTNLVVYLGAENLISSQRIDLLAWIIDMNRRHTYRQLLFMETNIFADPAISVFSRVTSFQPRLYLMTLYDQPDVWQFYDHMSQLWKFDIPESYREVIFRQCGGYLLLIKEALWYLRDHPQTDPQDIFTHLEMQFNLASLWHGFSPDEQAVLTQIAKHEPLEDPHLFTSLDYLEKMKIIHRTSQTYQLSVPLLNHYLQSKLIIHKTIQFQDGQFLLDGITINPHFSKRERQLLTYGLQHPHLLLHRPQIGELLWGNQADQKYSDWAIDSLLSRLRRKLISLGLPPTFLETKKGKGVIFHID